MNNIPNVVLEQQAVDAVLTKAQVTEKASSFDDNEPSSVIYETFIVLSAVV